MKWLLLLFIVYAIVMRWLRQREKPKYPQLGTWRERFNGIGRSRPK